MLKWLGCSWGPVDFFVDLKSDYPWRSEMAHSPSSSCYQHDSPPDRRTIQTFCWAASQRRDPCPKVLSRSPPSTIASFVDFVLRQDSDFSGSLSESSSSFSEASSSIFWSRSSETAFLCQYKDQLTISTFWSHGR